MVPGHGQVGEGVCVIPGHGGEAQAVARIASRLRGEGGRGAARVAQTGDGVVWQHLTKEVVEKEESSSTEKRKKFLLYITSTVQNDSFF